MLDLDNVLTPQSTPLAAAHPVLRAARVWHQCRLLALVDEHVAVGRPYGYDHTPSPTRRHTGRERRRWLAPRQQYSATGLNALFAQNQWATANITWTPVPAAQFQLEFRWEREIVWSGAYGTREQADFQTLFKF